MSDREVRIVPPNQTAAFQQWAFRRVEDSLADFDGQSVSERLTRALQAQAAAREAEQKRADVDPQVVEAIRADAQKAGYEEGLRLGREEAERELKANVAALASIADALCQPVASIDDAVQREITELAFTIGETLYREEMQRDPTKVVNVVREAVAALPEGTANIKISLNPEDAAVVDEYAQTSASQWQVLPDPAMGRGGCKVQADTSEVDATLDERLAAVRAALAGD